MPLSVGRDTGVADRSVIRLQGEHTRKPVTLPWRGPWPPPPSLWLDLTDPGSPLVWERPTPGTEEYRRGSTSALTDADLDRYPGLSRGATYRRLSSRSTNTA